MASNIIDAMNNITLEDEEEGGLDIEVEEVNNGAFAGFNAKLCVVARFITDGNADFQALQQTLASLWKPGKGVYIKELENNLYLFQFYHELDVKRVLDGSPWSFNRRALVMARLKEGDNPRSVSLNSMDLWVQIHDLKPGFMTEKIVKEVGNYIGSYVESCSTNFMNAWRDYMRVRVTIDICKPLKRRMKVRRTGDDWFWITFKYENVPTFCFICGLLGHSEKFCSRLFDTHANEIVKPYGAWMRAPLKRQVKQIGAKWLRSGIEGDDWKTGDGGGGWNPGNGKNNQDPIFSPHNQVAGTSSARVGGKIIQNVSNNVNPGIREENDTEAEIKGYNRMIETKKRRTDSGVGLNAELGLNTEIVMGSDEEDNMNVENGPEKTNDSKNEKEASALKGARLGL